jgi:hypothetical protein
MQKKNYFCLSFSTQELMNNIIPGLHLGDMHAAYTLATLRENQISHILIAADYPLKKKFPNVCYLNHLLTLDSRFFSFA